MRKTTVQISETPIESNKKKRKGGEEVNFQLKGMEPVIQGAFDRGIKTTVFDV